MRRLLLTVLATALPLAAASAEAEFPKLGAFEPGSGKIWFSGCTFEADRYVSCKSAAPEVIEAISNPGDQTPGLALQTYVSDVFIEKGCSFEAAPESFRVNGVFLSFDSKPEWIKAAPFLKGAHLGKRVAFESVPADVQKFILQQFN